jgi:glycosyltransferase involved in cell wall biosynthesis
MARILPDHRAAQVLRRGLDRPLRDDAWHRRQRRQLDAILANSEATRRTVLASTGALAPERVVVVHNGIDVDAFERYKQLDVRQALGIAPAAFVAGIIGRLTRQKAHPVAFEAFARFRAQHPEAELLVVGEGEEGPALRAHARALGIAPHFTGAVHPVQPYLVACDVVLVPSTFEGFCYVAAEAQLLSRPVVAARASSLPEVVVDESTGILVPPGEVVGFEAALSRLAGDPGRRAEMGRRGRAHVRAQFASDVITARLEGFFEDAIRWSQERA